jgi:CheY-like chemotaxis protein
MATPRALADSSSSSLLLSLIAQADDPMCITSLPHAAGDDVRMIAVNAAFCRLTSRSQEQLIDLGWLSLCSRRVDPLEIDRAKRALYRREHLALDLLLAQDEGLDVQTHCELLPIRDGRGLVTGMLVVQRDVSEQKQTRETLTSLRAMTRRTSHEVNNELASVIINLSLASSARATDNDRREHIRDALKAARGAAETAKRLSSLASHSDIESPEVDVSPLAPAPVAATPEAPATPETPPVPRVGSLLILEDDEIVKSLLANYLTSSGFDVQATCESVRCVELYQQAYSGGTPYDLVMLDLRIGRAGMGGLETLTALQAIDAGVRAIAHSGYSTDDVMLNPTRFGFVASIKKPTPPSEIARALTDLIRVHGSESAS